MKQHNTLNVSLFNRKSFLFIVFFFVVNTSGWAQTYHNLSGGSFSQNWTNTGLITVNDNWTGVPSIIGYRGDNITAATGVDPQTLLGEGTIVLNVTANQTNPNPILTGGVYEFELTDPVVAFQGSGTADAPSIVIYLNTTGVTNIQVQYNLRDIDGSADNAIQPVALQYRIGTTGNFTNISAGFVADAATGPSLATLVTAVNVTLPAGAENQAQLQLRIITSNAVGSDEWIGIDDIVISGTTGGATPPVLTADITNNDVDNNIDITFADDATWRGLITVVKINGTPITATTDYVLSAGNLQLKPSGLNTLLTTAGAKSVTIEATGYAGANVAQTINAGADVKLAMKTQPADPASNGGPLATQPAVFIQDQYGNTTSSTASVTASVGAGTWVLGGATSVAGIAGTATFNGLTATSPSAVSGATISFASGSLTGITSNAFNIPTPVPSLSVTPITLTGFTYSETAGPSPEKTFSVSGLNLTNDISIAATTNYEISLGTGAAFVATDPVVLTQSGGTISATTIYVRLKAGLIVGAYNAETINITSIGATSKTVTCSGDVTAWVPGLPLVEDFDYTVTTLLSANGWTNHSGTSNFITVTAPTITYPGYLSSSVGNEVVMTNGADVNRPFVSQISGSLYASFLVNVSAATDAGDYFFHFGETSGASVSLFGGRVWIKKDPSSSNFAFGVSKSSTAGNISYSAYDYLVGTTYLVIVKHNFVSGTNNDNCVLYVNPALNAAEPMPILTSLTADNASSDPSQYVSICLRQGSATTAPSLKLDGIRISKVWSDLVGNIILTPTITVNPNTLSGFTYAQASGPSAEQNFSVSGANLSGDITITPPTNYEISTGTGLVFAATNPIILAHTGGIVTATNIYVRLKAGLSVGNYNSELITLSAAGSNNPSVACNGNVTTPVPVLTLSPVSLSGFTSVSGTASTSLSYNISGDFLDGNVTLTAPSDFEISTDDVNFFPSLILSQIGGNLDGEPKTVFVRINAGAAPGTVSGNISHSSINLTSIDLPISGNVYLPEPTNHASNFTAVSPDYSTVTLTWDDNDGLQSATGYLILANTTGVFTSPVDGVAQNNDFVLSDGSGVANVAHGVQTFIWSGLSENTHYYFIIYPYTNTGNNINYKVVPAALAVDITTPAFILPLAAWTFDAAQAAPNTPTVVLANYGTLSGTAKLVANGTVGSSTWITATSGNELTMFSGTIVNDPRIPANQLAGSSYCPLSGTALSANGKSMVIEFSMTDFENPVLTYASRHSGTTAFNSHLWSYSIDGINFTPVGNNLAPTSTAFTTKILDLSSVDMLDDVSVVYLKVTFDGATGAATNNRLDNIVIRATELPQTKTLNLKACVEGLFYDGSGNYVSGNMHPVYDGNTSLPVFGANIADTVTVELMDATFANVVARYTGVNLMTNGDIQINTVPVNLSGNYYVNVIHRNSVPVTTPTAISFSTSPITHDYTIGATYGGTTAQKEVETGKFAMYSGELNRDAFYIIDGTDLSEIEVFVAAGTVAYVVSDLDGNGWVDGSDLSLLEPNVATGPYFLNPLSAKKNTSIHK